MQNQQENNTYCFIDIEFKPDGHIRELALLVAEKNSFKILQIYNIFMDHTNIKHIKKKYKNNNINIYEDCTLIKLICIINNIILKYKPLFISYTKADIFTILKEYYFFYSKEIYIKNLKFRDLKNKIFVLVNNKNLELKSIEKYCLSFFMENYLDFYVFANQRYKKSLSLEKICINKSIKLEYPPHIAINDTVNLYSLAKVYYNNIERF